MAFCNACGTNIESGAKFCPKCGASQPSATPGVASASPAPAAPPVQTSNTLKPLLIVAAAVVVVGAVAIAGLAVLGLHFARRTHVENRDGNVRVESPLGTVESTTDPSSISRDLGVDLYPGAHLLKGNAANVSIAGMHTVAAEFETDDSPDKVADFYKAKLPNAQHASASGDSYSIVATEKDNIVTIKIEPSAGKTLIHVANVSGKGITGNSSD
ncbi:MAG TPA: zinc ribbon domain-containing protein [Terriglobales bacterium]|nr:zinc ribbon domain-containing protein [Terriglobales bacterium]